MRAKVDVSKSWSIQMARSGVLPPRYGESVAHRFDDAARLAPGMSVLDVGSGRDPTFTLEERPEGVTYVGLDVSTEELALAPAGSYAEAVALDVAQRRADLEDRFDLVVSWQVFEHVRPLEAAVENLRRYLRPEGRLVAMMSGRFAPFALVNSVLPNAVGQKIASRVLRVAEDDVFPTRYHRCYASALARVFAGWTEVAIEPQYRGAVYFRPFGPLLQAYLRYESWAERSGRANLATHYLIAAAR